MLEKFGEENNQERGKEEYWVLEDKDKETKELYGEYREEYREGILHNLKILGGLADGIGLEKAEGGREFVRFEYPPVAVISTETSGIPFGYALKEGFKEAFPDKVLPKFFRINVKPFKNEIDFLTGKRFPKNQEDQERYQEAQRKFDKAVEQWKSKIEKFELGGKKVAIFDEVVILRATRESAIYLLQKAGLPRKDIVELFGVTGGYPIWRGREGEVGGRNPTEESRENYGEVKIVSEKLKIRQAQNLIHDMRLLGKEAAKELKNKTI